MPLFFALTLFLSAALLFAVQPMVGRMLLPYIGGSPLVWNGCLVFFQATLLGGYLYAHLITQRLSLRIQVLLQAGFLLLAWFTLPIAVRHDGPVTMNPQWPILWLLATLAVTAGLPFLVVSSTAPLLQYWFSLSRRKSAVDPYYLYAASNAGSLAALVAYPLFAEPNLSLHGQSDLWQQGYWILAIAILLCGGGMTLARSITSKLSVDLPIAVDSSNAISGKGSPLRWMGLAFIPSSLLVGITQHLTTDIAPIPLLWVFPLAIYLLTFILAFSTWLRVPIWLTSRALAISLLAVSMVIILGATQPLWMVMLVHLVTFFLGALLCHARLAALRPPADRLTTFYLWISFGGVLGGAFNALLAPLLFRWLGDVEYPSMLVVLCLVLQRHPKQSGEFRFRDFTYPLLLAAWTLGVIEITRDSEWANECWTYLSKRTAFPERVVRNAVLFALPVIVSFVFADRPIRFALALTAVLLIGSTQPGPAGRVIYLERSYLGTIRVTIDPTGKFRCLIHGNTIHGQERIGISPRYVRNLLRPFASASGWNVLSNELVSANDQWMTHEPLTYYYPNGPAGDLFTTLAATPMKGKVVRIGAVGLGVGSLAAYAIPEQEWTFYELDPVVEKVARDARFFTFLRDSRASKLEVILGDARLKLADALDGSFDVLVLDAFSSDAIPIHLLTAEARKSLRPQTRAGWSVAVPHLQSLPGSGADPRQAGPETRTSLRGPHLGGYRNNGPGRKGRKIAIDLALDDSEG